MTLFFEYLTILRYNILNRFRHFQENAMDYKHNIMCVYGEIKLPYIKQNKIPEENTNTKQIYIYINKVMYGVIYSKDLT